MYVDRLIEGEGARGWSGETVCLAVRPHWFAVVEQGAGGFLLMVGGTGLLLFGQSLRLLLTGLTGGAGWVEFLYRPAVTTGSSRNMAAGVIRNVELLATALDLPKILEDSVAWVGVAFAIVGALLVGGALLRRHFTEYAITATPAHSGRIIKVHGVLSRQTVAVPLGKVNDLEIDEPLLGRLLGWGNVDIETGNDYLGDRLEYVPDPRRFYRMWKMLIDTGLARRSALIDAASDAVSDSEW